MRIGGRLRVFRALRREQSGFAVPTALMALIAGFGLASVAVLSTVDVQQGTNRDHASKEAIAAADAGANVAMLRLNRVVSRLSTSTPCVGPNGETQIPNKEKEGWCPFSPTESIGGATYRYEVSAYSATAGIQVVSVGTAPNATRRVAVSLLPEAAHGVFEGERLIGEEGIHFGGNVSVHTDMGTNGTITKNGSSGILCGNERVGIGKANEAPQPSCEGVKTEGIKALPPVVPPTNIGTSNSNCRLAGNCLSGEVDTVTKHNGVSFNSAKRELTLTGNVALTMGGENYWLCKLNVNSGTIIMAVGSHVRIFIDTPEHCGLPSGARQVEFGGGSEIESTGFIPSQGFYELPGIYVVGNGSVLLKGNSSGENEVMLYAPLSQVEMQGTASWMGMIAGKNLNIEGTPDITSNDQIKEPPISYPPTLQRTRYVECSGAATTPNAGC
jgi:hypothetical protein